MVPLYTEVFSFQWVGIEELYTEGVLIAGGWNRGGSLYTEGVLISGGWNRGGSTVYRGVLISGSWNRGVPLYTEVFSFQVVGIERFHCIQRCSHFRWLE